jgi:membrane protein YdbS with pleckstrin-like domain
MKWMLKTKKFREGNVDMRPEPTRRIDPKAVKVWQLGGWINALFSTLIFAAVLWAAIYFKWPWFIPSITGMLVVLQFVIEVTMLPKIRWKRWKYEVSELDIELHHGIIIRRRTVIPMVRIQHVDTKQGPLLRKYNLASVTFSTAAGIHEIPAVSTENAEELRDRIGELARVSDEDA